MDLHSIKRALRKKWKWVAVSALAVGWITLQCGLSESSTNPSCTWITSAIRGLLLHTEIPPNALPNNTKPDTISRPTTLSALLTYLNSSVRFATQTKTTKFATSTAANTATRTNDLTTMSASSIIASTINNSSLTAKESIPTHHQHSRSTGPMASQLQQNSASKPQNTRPVTASKKSLANVPRNTISAVTNTDRPTGSNRNIFACRLDAENLQASGQNSMKNSPATYSQTIRARSPVTAQSNLYPAIIRTSSNLQIQAHLNWLNRLGKLSFPNTQPTSLQNVYVINTSAHAQPITQRGTYRWKPTNGSDVNSEFTQPKQMQLFASSTP